MMQQFLAQNLRLSDCRRKCDELPGCVAISYERNKKVGKPRFGKEDKGTICTLRNASCDVAPGYCDWSKGSCHWTWQEAVPAACPREMSESDPFWFEKSASGKRDEHCEPFPACMGPITNGVCLRTIRRLLNATDAFMRRHDVAYTLISGTLIGQARCGDVIPWDTDADISVLDTDRDKLYALLPKDLSKRQFKSLEHVGYPDVKFMSLDTEGRHCFPWRIFHVPTGVFVDVFSGVTVHDEHDQKVSRRPWCRAGPVAKDCSPSKDYKDWPGPPKRCQWSTCDVTPFDLIWPSKRCRFADFEVNCPKDVQGYLDHLYLEAILPDKLTRHEP